MVDVDNKQFNLDIIIRRLENEEIELDPEFQRGVNLWDGNRQSKLIESILIKLPLPSFYFDVQNGGRWVVVDGFQRLNAIKNFVVKKSLRLEGLDFLHTLDGKGYDDLPRPMQRRIYETIVFGCFIQPSTPSEYKKYIFNRIKPDIK